MIAARSHRTARPAHNRPADKRADVVPYDYGATFRITGRPGNVIQSVINTAPDSLFVAVAIGYGFEEDRGRPLIFDPAPQRATRSARRYYAGGFAGERLDRRFARQPTFRAPSLRVSTRRGRNGRPPAGISHRIQCRRRQCATAATSNRSKRRRKSPFSSACWIAGPGGSYRMSQSTTSHR